MSRDFPRDFQRILITRMKYAGDIVLTIPVIQAVRSTYPDAFLAYMGDSRAVDLLDYGTGLNEVIPFDFSRPTVLEQPRVAALLFRRRFDLVLDLFGNPRSALLAFLSGARVRVGPARRWRGALYTHQVRDDGRRKTAIDFHFQYLRAVGIIGTPSLPAITLREWERQRARLTLDALVGPPTVDSMRRPIVQWIN